MKIGPVGAELILVDRRTDITKLIVAFRNSVNAPRHDVRVDRIQRVLDTLSGASCKHNN